MAAYETFDYEKIRPDARKCPRFGTAFKDCSFRKPRSCIELGYADVCIMKRKCVYASHLCAAKWKEKRRRQKKQSVEDAIFGDAVSVAKVPFFAISRH